MYPLAFESCLHSQSCITRLASHNTRHHTNMRLATPCQPQAKPIAQDLDQVLTETPDISVRHAPPGHHLTLRNYLSSHISGACWPHRTHPERHRVPRRHQRAPPPAELPHRPARPRLERGGRLLCLPWPVPRPAPAGTQQQGRDRQVSARCSGVAGLDTRLATDSGRSEHRACGQADCNRADQCRTESFNLSGPAVAQHRGLDASTAVRFLFPCQPLFSVV